jgi:hypothetical protein
MAKTAFFDNELRRELKKIYFKTFALRIVSGLVSFVTVTAWVVLGVVLWTAVTNEPALWQTVAVSRGTLLVVALLFAYFVILPLVRTPRFSRLAIEMEDRKDFKHIVAAGYEFSEREDIAGRYSPELIREVIRQAMGSIAGLQVRFLFLGRRQLLLVPVAYLALVVLIIIASVSPSVLFDAGYRLVSPERASAVTHEANLFGSPGDLTVLAGSDVEVKAFDFGDSEESVTLSYNLAGAFWKTEPTIRSEVAVANSGPLSQYSYTFRDIRGSVTYYFRSGTQVSPKYRIDVVHKPIVTGLNIVLNPPAYTGEPADTLVDSGGNVQALEGTKVGVAAVANNTLRDAWVKFGSGAVQPVEVAGKAFAFEFVALEDGSYSILLEDEAQHKTDEPLAYSIEVYRDNPPVLDVLEPGSDATLPRSLVIDVGFIASDDYGIAKSSVFYRKNGEERFRQRSIALGGERGKREIAKSFKWDLSDITLFPGNYVEYFLQVEDNNVVTGPGVTKSRIFHIAVPTMAEIYERIQEEDSRRTDLFEETMTESRELKERLEKLAREFKKTEKMDWAQQKEIDKAISSQESIEEKMEEIQNSLEETLESLSDNQMTSQEIGEKLEEINRLIDEINDEALNQYVEELREAMEKLSPDEIQKALENLNLSAEDLLQSLERTESLLREIQREQEMEEVVRNTKELMDAQEGLNEETSETDEGNTDDMGELADKQQELADRAEQLAKEMQKAAENMDSQELSEQMGSASGQCSQCSSQSMKDAAQQLRQGQKQSAMENQEQAMNNLVSLFTKVVTMQMQCKNASQRQTAENLQRLAVSTLAVSFKQESLTNRLREQVSADETGSVRSMAKDQQTYTRAVEQVADELHEISKRSLSVSESMLEALGRAISNMRSSMIFMEQNKAFMSTASASQAVTDLNEATIELLRTAKASAAGGGSGTSAQMTQLQQMLQGQQQLLQESQALLEMRAAQEKLLQERQAAIQRLAGQQRSLKQLAEQMQKDLKDNKRILGRVDKMVEEMEEVIRDLEGGVLDEQTIRNEERIVSRLLDANRSVHSRDYEKKRLSVSAQDVFSNTAGGERAKPVSRQLREEIRRAMLLKAPGEFEDLIRLYFRALAEEAPPTANEK